jgi:DNA-binding GntR family transcriptional regulator
MPATNTAVNAVERAYEFSKERILDGRFAGGEMIREGEVAAGVGISRTPVREAFLRLQSEGLLRLYPKVGALVVPVSVSEIETVMETRLVIERHAIGTVIARGVELGDALDEQIERHRLVAEAGDDAGFVAADRAFHRLVIAAAGNAILLQVHDSMRDRQTRMGLTAIARDLERARQILDEHAALAAAMHAADATRAIDVIERHLSGTLALLLGTAPRSR